MPSVRKYPLQLKPKQTLKLEEGAVILPGIYTRWGEVVLYVMGLHKKLDERHTIKMFGTADSFNYDAETMKYLGNCITPKDCFHFFKVTEED